MNVKEISIQDFDYQLPEERIARHPLPDRDRCRMLVAGADAAIADDYFYNLPDRLPENALLICNNTRVINARMQFRKPTGAAIEIFLLEPLLPADYESAFSARGSAQWSALVGNLKKWKQGALEKRVALPDGGELILTARLGQDLPGGEHAVDLSWIPADIPFADVVQAAGYIPIPPYLNRETEASDATDYQTVYSRVEGSVAAPTAGLHFTPRLLERIDRRGISRASLTLHVGAGTFKPVKSRLIGEHPMHTETFTVSRSTLESIIAAKREHRPVVAVGTTSVRTLETLPLLADILAANPDAPLHLDQWKAYERDSRPDSDADDAADRLLPLLRLLDARGEDSFTATTAIMIAPGFPWSIVDGMITNFHQPSSTLLLLVSSFLDDRLAGLAATEQPKPFWRRIYDHALAADYRFLSYGDACLFI